MQSFLLDLWLGAIGGIALSLLTSLALDKGQRREFVIVGSIFIVAIVSGLSVLFLVTVHGGTA